MTPGAYIRSCRSEAGMSVHDIARWVDTEPPIDAGRRAQLIVDIEAGLVPVNLSIAVALAGIPLLGIDLEHLAALVDADVALRFRSQVRLLVLAGRP